MTETAVKVTGVTVAPKTVKLKVGETQQLTATVKPDNATDKSVSWSTSDNKVALVNSKGLVESIKEGSATITVTTTDGNKKDTSAISATWSDVDLSLLSTEHWPNNYVLKKSSIYLDIDEITLERTQKGRLVQTPEGFVFVRVDIAVINPPAMEMAFKFIADLHDLASFTIAANSSDVVRVPVIGRQSGDYLPETWVSLVNLGSRPKGKGRLCISVIGYQNEPWR